MAFSLVLSIQSGYYVVHHFQVNTDTDRLHMAPICCLFSICMFVEHALQTASFEYFN